MNRLELLEIEIAELDKLIDFAKQCGMSEQIRRTLADMRTTRLAQLKTEQTERELEQRQINIEWE